MCERDNYIIHLFIADIKLNYTSLKFLYNHGHIIHSEDSSVDKISLPPYYCHPRLTPNNYHVQKVQSSH